MIKKRKFVLYLLLVLAYVGPYVLLSVYGEYRITMSGEYRYGYGGFAVMDTYKWFPYGVICEIYRGMSGNKYIRGLNLLGAVYCPLVWVDRHYVHKTISLFDQSKIATDTQKQN